MGYFGALGIVAPRASVDLVLRSFAMFSDESFSMPTGPKLGADSDLEFSVLAVGFLGDCEEVIASLSLPKERVEKLGALVREF